MSAVENKSEQLPERSARQVLPGLFCLDANHPRPRTTCGYLVVKNGEAALIDCGGGRRGRDAMLAGLAAAGVAREAVRYLLATHAHLDHAGAAGLLMNELPQAEFCAHPSALRHLTDPEAALAPASRALYGGAFYEKYYGGLAPVPAARARELADEARLPLGAGELTALHTPGHAWHHASFWDADAGFVAAGDAYGVSYRQLDAAGGATLAPVSPPSQFNPPAMRASIERLHTLGAQRIGLAHFDVLDADGERGERLRQMQLDALDDWEAVAARLFDEERDTFYARMKAHILDWASAQAQAAGGDAAAARELHENDASLSALGFEYYLKKNAAA